MGQSFPKGKAQKDLILFVRSRHCGELNRGLENLGTFHKGNGLVLFAACKKYRKNTPRVATLWTPGTIQISARYIIFAKVTGVHQVTGRAGNCKVSGYRRWGFESVRKGCCTSDARLRSFEKGMLYCKLTVASGIRKGLLHVSLGAVGICCRGALNKSFPYIGWFCMSWKHQLFSQAKAFLLQVALHEL